MGELTRETFSCDLMGEMKLFGFNSVYYITLMDRGSNHCDESSCSQFLSIVRGGCVYIYFCSFPLHSMCNS